MDMMQKQRILAVVVMTLSLLCGMPATAADLYSTISNVGYIDDGVAISTFIFPRERRISPLWCSSMEADLRAERSLSPSC